MDPTSEELLEKLEVLQNILISRAQYKHEAGDDEEYRNLRAELMSIAALTLPRFVRTCRSLSEFWDFIKANNLPTYQSRRIFIRDQFRPDLDKLEFKSGPPGVIPGAKMPDEPDRMETEHQQPKAPRVFLAHAAEDKKSVRELYERLAAHGLRPWLDEVDLLPGQAWQTEIKQAINQSDAVLACLSRNSVHKAGYVQKEFRLALSAYAAKPIGTIYLIPVKLDETETPDISIPELGVSLRDIQWLDLSATGGFERLLEAIKRSAGSPAAILRERPERDYDRPESALRGALQEIKSKTHGLYPAIVKCVQSGADRTEAIIRDNTFRSVEAYLDELSASGLLEFDIASPEPYDTARRIRLHILERALLRTIIDDVEGID